MAFKADMAYKGSLELLSSLSHLTEMDVGSFKVRALSHQENPLLLLLMPSLLFPPQVQPFPGLHPCWRITR